MGPLPNVTVGLDALRRDNPWPDLPVHVEPFYLSLDGGGRNLITDLIREREITLMLEVGCFLCGSTRQWLDASPDLEVIGVDPWDGNWSLYVRERFSQGNRMMNSLDDPSAIADTIQRYGNYCLALNNIRDERNRFIPVRQRSPEALHYLKRRSIQPQLIYIDALKSDEDLWVAHELFPRAILCGDDWTWRDDDGRYRMREHVQAFAAEKDFDVRAEDATWLVTPRRPVRPAPVEPRAWDADAAALLMAELDDVALELLRAVAAAERAGAELTFDAATRDLASAPDALLLATQRVNEATASTGRVQVLELGGTGGDGWDGIGHRPYVLAAGLAALVPSR